MSPGPHRFATHIDSDLLAEASRHGSPSQTAPATCAVVEALRRQRYTGQQSPPATVSRILRTGPVPVGYAAPFPMRICSPNETPFAWRRRSRTGAFPLSRETSLVSHCPIFYSTDSCDDSPLRTGSRSNRPPRRMARAGRRLVSAGVATTRTDVFDCGAVADQARHAKAGAGRAASAKPGTPDRLQPKRKRTRCGGHRALAARSRTCSGAL
jgi:hypothetical protein